ncbi:Xyloglucan endotransglucosylase/hydrolase [Parasponia andersonii]|uniref:Xyloglucan endotransglucosylase/hydrolase n=1 Tax=Parasponia andersonii TaxID=3476 RepID=A0A2P5DC27_PARAD|nr:Xyloglucan endotransglucosylase/hydrolase [Parasponia andersonii]
MAFSVLVFFVFLVLGCRGLLVATQNTDNTSFDQNYQVTWGFDHVLSSNQGREIQLSMDKSSGAGFESKLSYGSGFFNLWIKLPDRDSAGVITAYYLTSIGDKHDELDFEFLGNREGKPYTLQTNVFANGHGNREQRTLLWFDPTADYHTYAILWNLHQIVYKEKSMYLWDFRFFVDNIPIRVFKNNTSKGVDYPSKAMKIEASLWDGDSWATDGGQTKTDWAYAPFKAHFQGFHVYGCSVQIDNSSNNVNRDCYSENNYFWNTWKYQRLDSDQRRAYENVRKNYMNYDYCTDRSRYPTPPPECLDQP